MARLRGAPGRVRHLRHGLRDPTPGPHDPGGAGGSPRLARLRRRGGPAPADARLARGAADRARRRRLQPQLSDKHGGAEFSEDDEAILVQLAGIASAAIHKSQVYEERAAVVEALQRTLRPSPLPSIPRVALGSRYRPYGHGLAVGGDFYDVIPVGRRRWAVVLGDVCGKGPEAAAITGLVRHTVRAVVHQAPKPHVVLDALDPAILEEQSERFCTVVYGLLEATADRTTMQLACAGHPLPVLLSSSGDARAVGASGTVLGILPTVSAPTVSMELLAGDSLLLYSDGLTEGGGSNPLNDKELLRLLRSLVRQPAQRMADVLADVSVARRGDSLRDDLAVLVVQAA